MTITTTTSKVTYTGNNSTTVFAYTFKIFADAEIKVYVDAVLKTISTHYNVSGAGSASGGNVTFTGGNTPGTGAKVVLLRNIAKTQVTDYVENDSFPAETHESALDKLNSNLGRNSKRNSKPFLMQRKQTLNDSFSSLIHVYRSCQTFIKERLLLRPPLVRKSRLRRHNLAPSSR